MMPCECCTSTAPYCTVLHNLLQAALKHPYYRYGYVGAVLFGLLGWAIASEEKKHEGVQLSSGQAAGGGTA